MKNKKRYEIIIHGRGGQGAKTTAEVLAQAALRKGKQVQAFPEFGPERSGAPMKAFVRISDDPIRTHEPVVDPDCVLVLDDSIPETVVVTKNITGAEAIIVNTKMSKKDYAKKLKFSGNVITVDASRMSLEITGENRPNTVILGKFVFVTELVDIEDVCEAFRDMYETKIGNEMTQKNIEAIEKAYGSH